MTWPYEYTPYIWSSLLSVLFLAAMGLYALRNLSAPGVVPFIVLLVGLMLWVLCNTLLLAATDDATRFFWFKLKAVLLLPIVTAELCFALVYAGLGDWVTRRTLSALVIAPLAMGLLVATNNFHHLIWKQISFEGYIRAQFGPVYWGGLIYACLLSLLHLMALLRLFVRSPRHRGVAVGLICAPLIIRLAYFSHSTNWNPIAPLDPMVVIANVALLPYAFAVFRFRMFDVVPLARDTVIERMAVAMVVFDNDKCLVDVNESAQRLLGIVRHKVLGRTAAEVLHGYPDLLALLRNPGAIQAEVRFGNSVVHWYQASVSLLADRRGFQLGRLVWLDDITEQKNAREQLLDQQRTLAMMQERELLARELHDGVGQMLAAAHLQVRTASELLAGGDTTSAGSCLNHVADVTQAAKQLIREYLLGVKSHSSGDRSLLEWLRGYLDHYGRSYGIQCELVALPELEERRIDSAVEAQLQPIIQEALVNVKRHSGASSVRVIFSLHHNRVRITVEDNGGGFDLHQIDGSEGFGLRSMRGRAEAVGADLQVVSGAGKGTSVVISVPRRKDEA